MKFSLALAGGGVKGIAFVAFFDSLEKYLKNHGYKKKNGFYSLNVINYIAFTSSASFFTSAYFLGFSFDDIIRISRENFSQKIPVFVSFFIWRRRYTKIIDLFFSGKRIRDLPFSPVFVTTDLIRGERYVLKDKNMPLPKAIYASTAHPASLKPLKYKGRLLSDGGSVELVPSKTLREMTDDKIIGVRLNNGFKKENRFSRLLPTLLRTQSIMSEHYVDELEKYCDYMIQGLKSTRLSSYAAFSSMAVFDEKKLKKYYKESKAIFDKEIPKILKEMGMGPR